ncbi:MFS transporter [candidate division WOR-3 bacterium]|uniref:MFS transporter n=1 Tax=candidate division WOR-3 bacterium TaxID=2052148 RepID=A0A9D5KAJ5_UNCW3|nr:MFS transporter [candidate division WOR-3 bacterium]
MKITSLRCEEIVDQRTEADLKEPAAESFRDELADIGRSGKGLFKNRGFRLFSASQGASLLGDKLGYIALIEMVRARFPETSSQVLATVMIVMSLPTLVFGPFFLMLVDRMKRKTVLIISDVVRLAVTIGGPLVIMFVPGVPVYWALMIILLIFFTFTFTFNSVRLSIVPDIVRNKEHLHGANSFLNFLNRISVLVGITGGSFLVVLPLWEKLGIEGWSSGFFADGLTFAVSAVALLLLRVKSHLLPARKQSLGEATEKISGGFRAMGEVLKFIFRNPVVLAGILSIIQFGVFNTAMLVLIVPIVQTHLGLGTQGVGILGLAVGLGFIVGSALYGFFGKRIPKTHLIFISYGMIGVSMGAVAILPLIGLAQAGRFYIYIYMGVVAFLAGILYHTINTAHDTLIHEEVPGFIRGRIFSAREWLYNFSLVGTALLLGGTAYLAHPFFLTGMCGLFFGLTCLVGMIYVWAKIGKDNNGYD